MRGSFPIGGTVLLTLAVLVLAGCGIGSGGAESKISDRTDTYLRSLASGDSAKACAQLADEVKSRLTPSCAAAMSAIAARVGRDALVAAADGGSSISVDGATASATFDGLNGARLGLVEVGSTWFIDSGYELDGRQAE